jgi:molybdopterin/thiamine biosynthesis adenylyltransferase
MTFQEGSEEDEHQKEINIDDEGVKDRWSRYIGAMGIEAVAKQAESSVLLSGLGGLGVEIAKNLVLAGCKELILHDTLTPSWNDIGSQFFLEASDVGSKKTRALLCKSKLQELNSYVKVSILENKDMKKFLQENPKNIRVAVFTDNLK